MSDAASLRNETEKQIAEFKASAEKARRKAAEAADVEIKASYRSIADSYDILAASVEDIHWKRNS
jgi:hypothetical protein